jgi:hypothetical protein
LSILFSFSHQDSISEIAGKCYKSYTYAVPMEARRAWLACTVRESEREVAVEVVEELITLRVSLNMLEGATGYVSCVLFPLLSGNEKNTTTTTTMKKGSPSGRSLVLYLARQSFSHRSFTQSSRAGFRTELPRVGCWSRHGWCLPCSIGSS